MKKKWIYLIKAESDNNVFYKIGLTGRDPYNRLKELQTGNALKLEIVNLFETDYGSVLESTIHRELSIQNESGEWFSLSVSQVENFLNMCNRIENNLHIIYEQNTYVLSKKNKF